MRRVVIVDYDLSKKPFVPDETKDDVVYMFSEGACKVPRENKWIRCAYRMRPDVIEIRLRPTGGEQ